MVGFPRWVRSWRVGVAAGFAVVAAAAGLTAGADAGAATAKGGSFDTVAGQPRVDLAAVTTSTGALLPWAPNTSPPFGTVQTLAATGNTVYVGGNFLQLQGHTGLAAFTADTGTLIAFRADINPGGEVATLATAPDGTLYADGGFTDIAGSDHDNLAALTP